MDAVRTRPLVEGALLAALTALLGLLAFYTGLGWVQPMPVLLAYMRHGARTATLVCIVSAAVLGLWIGPISAVASLGFVIVLGLVPGWTVRRGAGPAITIATMTLGVIVLTLIGAGATMLIWHDNVWADLWSGIHRFLYGHTQLLRQSGLDPATAERSIAMLLPVAGLCAAVAESVGVYALSSSVLTRLGQPLPPVPPFAAWRAPRWLIWFYVASLLAVAAGSHIEVKGVQTIAWNLLAAVGIVYSVVGVAFAYGWFRSRGLTRGRAIALAAGGAWILSALGLSLALPAVGVFASHWPSSGRQA